MIQNLQNKRVGLVLPNVPAYSETFFTSKIKGLQENGFEVILFANRKLSHSYNLTRVVYAPDFTIKFRLLFELVKMSWNIVSNFKSAFSLYKITRKEETSLKNAIRTVLINSHFLPFKLDWLHFGFGTMAIQRENVAEAIGAKMAISFRGFDLYIYPTKHINCYQKLFSKNVQYHVLSNEMKNTLMGNGISEQSIFKITPAIDFDSFNRKTPLDFNTPIRFLTVGRLHWKKGLEYILEALAYFKQNKNIPFTFTIIGDGVETERLKFAVYQLSLTENVIFVGKVAHQEVKKYMEQSHVYLQYSIQEGFCNAVLEAQAMGLFCIVSDADGLNENVLNKETGWVVPMRKPKELAEEFNNYLLLPELQKKEIINNAISRIKIEFSIENQKTHFLNFYN